MEELRIQLREMILEQWNNSFPEFDITNFNIGRTATGVFSLIIYPRKKLKKGEQREIKIKLDKDKTTLLLAIEVMESIIDEIDSVSLLSKMKKKKPLEKTGF